MKLTSVIIPTLAVVSFTSNLNNLIKSTKGFELEISSETTLKSINEGVIAYPASMPEKVQEEGDQLEWKVFKAVYAHYNYLIITCFIIAYDEKQAGSIAERFKKILDTQSALEQRGEWKMHVDDESKSNEEIVAISEKAQLVYTLSAGEKI